MIKKYRLDQRGSMTEYALVAIVTGITALFLLGRYGGSVGSQYSSATKQVDRAQPGQIVTGADVAPVEPVVPEGEASDADLKNAGSAGGGGGPRKLPVAGMEFDLSTVIWLGIAIVVVGVAMIAKIFKAAKQEDKKRGPA